VVYFVDRSSHELSHKNASARAGSKIRWPWEKLVNDDLDNRDAATGLSRYVQTAAVQKVKRCL